jgi:hypothetical protein
MNDCNHSKIKCMQCHRYITQGNVPITNAFAGPALARIKELELEVLKLKSDLECFQITDTREIVSPTNKAVMKGWPGGSTCA